MATNIVTAAFSSGSTVTKTAALYQWDYGQVLQITGLDLPDAFEAHFTNTLGGGWAKTQIGTTSEGVGTVTIPDAYLESGQPVYCYIYLHNGETDGETEYMITIPVKARAVPLGEAVTHEEQGVIQQYMAALTAAADKAEQEAGEAEESAGDAAESATEAEASATRAAGSAGEAEQSASAAAASAQTAQTAEQGATTQAQAAAQSAAAASASEQAAGNSATAAAGSATAAEQEASDAAASAAAALAQANAALAQAQAAAQSAAQALAQAQAAQAARTAAETAQGLAEDAQAGAEAAEQRTEELLDTKGDTLTYDQSTGELDLMAGAVLLSSVTIESGGGSYTLTYDSTTGRLSLLADGVEVSYVILSGLPVTITQEGDVLHVNNVPAISTITQDGDVLALT